MEDVTITATDVEISTALQNNHIRLVISGADLSELNPQTIVDAQDTDELLDAIGEDAAMKHFDLIKNEG
jgi:hypothetical protein